MSETYGQRIARLRKDRDMTQRQLAEASGVPLRTIQDVEGDKRERPQRATRIALDAALDVEGDAEEERGDWPPEVQVFLDVMGAYLTSVPPAARIGVIRRLTTQIIDGGLSGKV